MPESSLLVESHTLKIAHIRPIVIIQIIKYPKLPKIYLLESLMISPLKVVLATHGTEMLRPSTVIPKFSLSLFCSTSLYVFWTPPTTAPTPASMSGLASHPNRPAIMMIDKNSVHVTTAGVIKAQTILFISRYQWSSIASIRSTHIPFIHRLTAISGPSINHSRMRNTLARLTTRSAMRGVTNIIIKKSLRENEITIDWSDWLLPSLPADHTLVSINSNSLNTPRPKYINGQDISSYVGSI